MFVFEWDDNKAKTNLKKHGVSFEEAQSVFLDENARIIPDPDHSEEEDRFIILGLSLNVKLLVVCHCYRDKEKIIRIISARKATKTETGQYQEFL
ncbi:MAG: BrnT family toxin [Candidatus Rifleibacteriota bacterium]